MRLTGKLAISVPNSVLDRKPLLRLFFIKTGGLSSTSSTRTLTGRGSDLRLLSVSVFGVSPQTPPALRLEVSMATTYSVRLSIVSLSSGFLSRMIPLLSSDSILK